MPTNLQQPKNIVITGFMGTGKTTVGKLLAARLGYRFVDTDHLIEAEQGRPIPRIFAESGEATFRQLETDLARRLAGETGLVIATGGGLMLNPQNVAHLNRHSYTICLTAPPAEILARLQADRTNVRPLLAGPNPAQTLADLLQQREAVYRQFTQISTAGKSPAEIVTLIINFVSSDAA